MAATKTPRAITTTAGVLYTNPKRIKVRKGKFPTRLTVEGKIQVATLMNLTQLSPDVIARMFNICRATAYVHAKAYRNIKTR